MKILSEKPWFAFQCPNCGVACEAEATDARVEMYPTASPYIFVPVYFVECGKCWCQTRIPNPDGKLTADIKMSAAVRFIVTGNRR